MRVRFKGLIGDDKSSGTGEIFCSCGAVVAPGAPSLRPLHNRILKHPTLVLQSRANFTHIDDEELGSRRNFCTTVSARLHTLKSSMNSPAITEKLRADELALARTRGGDLGARSKEEHANTDFIHTQQADATMMMRQQDEVLTDLDSAVDRVGNLASTINVELSAQNKMIDELGEDLDEAEARMGLVMGKLSKLLKTKDGCQLWTIIMLTLVLLVLCFLVFYIP